MSKETTTKRPVLIRFSEEQHKELDKLAALSGRKKANYCFAAVREKMARDQTLLVDNDTIQPSK
jgi:hypothetical protein